MARNTLYPRLPGEMAVDKLLNQTLPNILQQRQARLDREEDIARQEKIRQENLAINERRYQQGRADKDLEKAEAFSDKMFTLKMQALGHYEAGNFSAGDATIDKIVKDSTGSSYTLGFNPEELRTEGQRRGNVKSKHKSITTNFYQAQDSAAVESSIDQILTHYKENSDIIDFDRDVQPILSYVLQNRETDLYRDLYQSKDFNAFASGTKNYVAFQNSIQFKLTDDIRNDFYQQYQRTGSNEEYEKFYFNSRQSKENTKVAADAYMNTTASNFETNNFSNYFMEGDKLKGQFTEAEFARVYNDYRQAMTKREYGATKDYSATEGSPTSITAEQKKNVDSLLSKEYGWPTVNFGSKTPPPGGDSNGDPDKTSKARITELGDLKAEQSKLISKGKTEGLTEKEIEDLENVNKKIQDLDYGESAKKEVSDEIASIKLQRARFMNIVDKKNKGKILTVKEAEELENARSGPRHIYGTRKQYRDKIISLQRELKGKDLGTVGGSERVKKAERLEQAESELVELQNYKRIERGGEVLYTGKDVRTGLVPGFSRAFGSGIQSISEEDYKKRVTRLRKEIKDLKK